MFMNVLNSALLLLFYVAPHIVSPEHIVYRSSNEFYEREVVRLVNQHRNEHGLKPLIINKDLTQAARYHALDMGSKNYFSHDTQNNSSISSKKSIPFYERVREFFKTRVALGENIGGGYTSPEAVVRGWMNSKGHRENILHSGWTSIGVGYIKVDHSVYGHYWVQDFAGN